MNLSLWPLTVLSGRLQFVAYCLIYIVIHFINFLKKTVPKTLYTYVDIVQLNKLIRDICYANGKSSYYITIFS